MLEGKKLALVHITVNAVAPLASYLRTAYPQVEVRNYLDGYLLEKINREGGITDASMERMVRMIATACQDGADAVLMTCTMFSRHQEPLSSLFSVPLLGPDSALWDTFSKLSGKKLILCTFTGTVETTKNVYLSHCRKNGMSEDVDILPVPEAFVLAQSGDMAGCNQKIRETLVNLDPEYDHIALAQVSMSEAAQNLTLKRAKVYTSPACVMEKIAQILA